MVCIECGMETANPRFCSRSCSASYNNRRNPKRKRESNPKCLNCANPQVKQQKKFCSNECQSEYNYRNYIAAWKAGYEDGMRGEYGISHHLAKYIKEKYSSRCARCGWQEVNPYTGNVPLEIEHIDGDFTNNSEENLTLLCPNCHSLTPTYKGANRGHGRAARSKYYNDP